MRNDFVASFQIKLLTSGLFNVDGKQEENVKKQISFLLHSHCITICENYSRTQSYS